MKTLIFDTQEFIEIHKPDRIIYFETIINNNKISLNVPVFDNIVNLPAKGSYSFFTVPKKLSLKEVDLVICDFEIFLKANNIQKINITFPPDHLDNAIKSFIYIMNVRGWTTISHDLSSMINLDLDFKSNYSSSTKKNKKKGFKTKGLTFKQANCAKDWIKAYECLYNNRKEKGYVLAMDYNQILEMKKFKIGAYILESESTVFSAAIVYFHSEEFAQIIYWGSISSGEKIYLHYRLVDELFDSLKSIGIKRVDIGTCTNAKTFNSGLLVFKSQFGAMNCFNYNLKLNLDEINL